MERQTRTGLSFGQLISVVSLFGAILFAWVQINVRIAQSEVKIEELEKGRIQNATNIEVIRTENREDHKEILDEFKELRATILERK